MYGNLGEQTLNFHFLYLYKHIFSLFCVYLSIFWGELELF